jgi:hypothetical protein
VGRETRLACQLTRGGNHEDREHHLQQSFGRKTQQLVLRSTPLTIPRKIFVQVEWGKCSGERWVLSPQHGRARRSLWDHVLWGRLVGLSGSQLLIKEAKLR